MPLEDKSLSIGIHTTFDGKGAKEAIAATNQITSGTVSYGEVLDRASEKTRIFGEHQKDVKKAIVELSRDFPIAGMALRAFASPLSAALTAGIGLFVVFKRHLAEVNASLDAMGDISATRLGNMGQAMRQAQAEVAANTQAYVERIATAQQAEDDFEQAVRRSIQALRDRANAEVEVTDAEEALALTEADQQFVNDPIGRLNARQQIQDRFALRRDEARTRAAETEIRTLESSIAMRSGAAPQLEAAAQAAFGAANNRERLARIGPEGLPAQITALDSRLTRERALQVAAEERVQSLSTLGGRFRQDLREWFLPAGSYQTRGEITTEAENRRREVSATEAARAAARNRLEALQAEQREAGQRSSEAQRLRDENAAALRRSTEDRDRLIDESDLQNATRATTRGLRTRQRRIQTGAAISQEQDRIISSAADGADAILAGRQVTNSQAAAMEQAARLLHIQNQNQSAIIAILSQLNDSAQQFNQGLQGQREVIQQLRQNR